MAIHPWLAERPWPTTQLQRAELEDKIQQMLASTNMGALGTNGPKGLIVTPIEYYASPDFELFMVPQPGSPKLVNIQANPEVSFAVFNTLGGFASARGCQLFGTMDLLSPDHPDWPHAISIYKWQASAAEMGRPTAEPSRLTLGRLRANRITYTDHWLRKHGFAARQMWKRTP